MELEMTQEAFARTVNERVLKGLSFLEALYATLDEYQAFGRTQNPQPVACSKGCPMCCYQLVCLHEPEMEIIWRHLEEKPSRVRKSWRERIRKAATEWRSYFNRIRYSTAITDPFRLAKDWIGKPCPFLEQDGTCGIYGVRPLPCRTTTSSVRCTKLAHLNDGQHSRQMRFQSEEWANGMLQEEMERRPQFRGVTPIQHFFSMYPNRI